MQTNSKGMVDDKLPTYDMDRKPPPYDLAFEDDLDHQIHESLAEHLETSFINTSILTGLSISLPTILHGLRNVQLQEVVGIFSLGVMVVASLMTTVMIMAFAEYYPRLRSWQAWGVYLTQFMLLFWTWLQIVRQCYNTRSDPAWLVAGMCLILHFDVVSYLFVVGGKRWQVMCEDIERDAADHEETIQTI